MRDTGVASRLVLVLGLVLGWPASAHTTATGLVAVSVEGRAVTYRLTVVPGELAPEVAALLRRAADGDQASAQGVARLIAGHVALRLDDAACAPERTRIQGSGLGEERVQLEQHFRCAGATGALSLGETWTAVLGPHYRSVVDVRGAGAPSQQLILDADHPSALISHRRGNGRGLLGFVRFGVEHILSGLDHLLFIAALAIGSLSLLQLLGVISAFTVAHSVTLALAALHLARVPAGIVEPLIAASIVYMAVENLMGADRRQRWLVTFGFGLVHGFGFASALAPLQLGGWALARGLVGFNSGVELGQAAVVLCLWPLLQLGRGRLRARWTLQAPSAAIALCGAVWLVGRVTAQL